MEKEWKKVAGSDMKNAKNIKLLDSLGHAYTIRDTSKALFYLNKALTFSRKINYWKGTGSTYLLLGDLESIHGNYLEGLKYYLKTRQLFREKGDKRGEILSSVRIATSYRFLGDDNRALTNFFNLVPYFKEKGDSYDLGTLFKNVALIYSDMGMYKKDLHYLWLAHGIFTRLNKPYALSGIYNDLGKVYEKLNKPDSVYVSLKKAMKIGKENHYEDMLSSSYFNLGDYYANTGDITKALQYHFRAVAIWKKLGLKYGLCSSYYRIGQINIAQNNTRQALRYAKMSLRLAKKIRYPIGIQNAYLLLSKIEEKDGRYENSLRYYKRYDIINDSLFSDKKSKRFAELTIIYETKQKEQEIKLLQKKHALQQAELKKELIYRNSFLGGILFLLIVISLIIYGYRLKNRSEKLLKEKNRQLSKLNEEKNEFLKIAAHDLKNPLIGIFSMVQMMSDSDSYFKLYDKETFHKHAILMKDSAGRMINLVDELMDINTIESGIKNLTFKQTSLNEPFLKILDNYTLQLESKDLTVITNLPDHPVVLKTDPDAFYRIMDNLLSNAIKYSPFHKKIYFSLADKDDLVILSVKDEGPGIPDGERALLFTKFASLSSQPTNGEHSTGLGLYIAKKLVENLNGNIYYNSQWTQGAEFIVEFSLNS